MASVLSSYKIIDGTPTTATQVRNQLAVVSKVLADKGDVKWAFPYVYSLVTNQIITSASSLTYPDIVFRWIANFYELYILNLNAFISSGGAESPWVTAFTAIKRPYPNTPWGALSMASFILGMYAHIKSDLPRAIAFVYLKFYYIPVAQAMSTASQTVPATTVRGAGLPPLNVVKATGKGLQYDDAKHDFDIMNDKIFPAVMNQMVSGGTNILPSFPLASLPDGWRTGVLNSYAQRSGLDKEREDAWMVGREYANDSALQAQVPKMPVSSTITPPGKI